MQIKLQTPKQNKQAITGFSKQKVKIFQGLEDLIGKNKVRS